MDGLRAFWTWVYVVGLGGFACVALVMMPLGLRDLIRLLKELASDDR